MDTLLADHFDKLLEGICTPNDVRAIEAGASVEQFWAGLQESGFLDALLPEASGGAGLGLDDVAPLLFLLGARAIPLPVGETMVARALLDRAGQASPTGPIVLAAPSPDSGSLVPSAAVASHVLLDTGHEVRLYEREALDVRDPGIHGSLALRVQSAGDRRPLAEIERPAAGLASLAAVIRAAQIAGAAGKVLEMSITYAKDRIQFGKPIGAQQAIQQNLAVMAELSIMTGMAARIGCSGGLSPSIELAAVAKQASSMAACEIANIAHAVHGAIGISEEFDLQLLTRRLHEWRTADGSDSWWARRLGQKRLASDADSSVAYIRSIRTA
jgi:acyl-CoA dehydrogenase